MNVILRDAREPLFGKVLVSTLGVNDLDAS